MVVPDVQVLVTVFFKIIFAILGGGFLVIKVTPSLKSLLSDYIRNQKAIVAFIYLINIFVIVFTASLILGFFSQLGNITSFLLTVKPAFDIILAFFNYIQWILVAIVFAIVFTSLNKSP